MDNYTNYPSRMICVNIRMEETGANIKQLVKARGYSVEDMMEITGVTTPQAVYKWYSGKSIPSIEVLIVLSKVLGVSIRRLIITDEDVEQHRECLFSKG